jgi:hypothetical protein
MATSEDAALNTFIHSVEAEAKAVVFSQRIPDYAARFATTYARWSHVNADALSRGKALAGASGMLGEAPPSVIHFAKVGAQVMAELPHDDFVRRAEELLATLDPPASSV